MTKKIALKYSMLLLAVLGLAVASSAHAQKEPACGAEVKASIVKLLADDPTQKDPTSKEALKFQEEIYQKYKYCAADGENLSADEFAQISPRYCGKLSYLGSTYYEQMRCCGYDPQKKLFGCPVEVKQTFGFGPAPFPGSREHVLSCVDFGGGYQPVALDNVHLADAVSGAPIWNFAVIARANERLSSLKLNGKTLRARSILSWQLAPTSCNYTPIWGNVVDYQIRLDP